MRQRQLLTIAIALAGAAANADHANAEEVLPLSLPPLFDVDDAANVSATITDSKRAISAQWEAAEDWLGVLGGGGVIDDVMQSYSLQAHAAFGRRFTLLRRIWPRLGWLRVGIDARLVGEAIWTQPGKDDDRDVRLGTDGGLGAWIVTPRLTRIGLHVGWESSILDPIDRPVELVVGVSLGVPYGEPDPHPALTEQKAVEDMLTTDPHKWPYGAYVPRSTRREEETIVSVGLVYVRPTDDMFEQRLVLLLGVLYP